MSITAARRNQVTTAVNRCRAKWGLSQNCGNVSAGNKITAADTNTVLGLIREAKTKSGWGGTVNNNVAVGSLITDIYTHMITASDNINAHCPCNGNCTGSCTGSCSTTCSGGCAAACRDACSGSCGGCGYCGCSCGGCGAGGNKRISPISPYYSFKTEDILNDKFWRYLKR